MEGCSCRTGSTGYQCEFILDSSGQDDRAQNDSNSNPNESENGVENNDYSYDFNQDDHSSNNNKNEIPCADGYCFNGGNCVTEQIISQNGSSDIREYCDCSEAYDANSNYAGLFCQYKSTSLCFVENSLQGSLDETFCVHYGACQEDGSCDCPSGWTGQYCEVKTLELDQNSVIDFDFDKCSETVCYNGGTCVHRHARTASPVIAHLLLPNTYNDDTARSLQIAMPACVARLVRRWSTTARPFGTAPSRSSGPPATSRAATPSAPRTRAPRLINQVSWLPAIQNGSAEEEQRRSPRVALPGRC